MLCKNAHSITTKVLERYDNRINPPGNRMVMPPETDKEWAIKLLRARLLPGKGHCDTEQSESMGHDGGCARGVIESVNQGTTPKYIAGKKLKGIWRHDACPGQNMRNQNEYLIE